ncbi:MarR family winged helix-turn-helix transcriptional regulator [Cellulomonas fimi]|uniref:Winged helix-turn-helix transcriptional regulator n=1 Tax=Cellulomonas fimi TaxID=1708 RepID=A0A7Y0LXL7_CELFI|nr:MarR family winged helix-turn-helix transcriptional regulator [Cellulomonas fimi]NMR19761.1 winged helix-turn-helix transcriptional regulator [Cellulomonas fimi]
MAGDPFSLVERELGLLLRRARASSAAMAARVHPDLDAAAYPLLVHVSRAPGVRSSDLAAHFGVGRATISRQVRRLEELGLLARRADAADSRAQRLELTPDAERRVTTAQDARRAWLRAALEEWPPDDVAVLAGSIGRLNAALDRATNRT